MRFTVGLILLGLIMFDDRQTTFAQAVPLPATQPVCAGARIIRSRDLIIELMDPDAADRYYHGVRFTPVAAVLRAAAGGHEYLFHKAHPNPDVDVAGLFGEFDLQTDPPAFAAAAQGETFVKIGVGRLTKNTTQYAFYKQYPVVELAKTICSWQEDAASFEQNLPEKDGYGYELKSNAKVADRTLTLSWTLKNTGAEPITTQQYLHNCFQFDGRPLSPGYELALPFDFVAQGLKTPVEQRGRQIVLASSLKKPMNLDIRYPTGFAGMNGLTVRDATSGLQVVCTASLPGTRIAVHMADTYLCPEQFIEITLKPGQSQQWERTYLFE